MSIESETAALRARGRKRLQKTLGEKYLQNRDSNTNWFNKPYMEYSETACYAMIWDREGLDLKIRSLVNLGMFTAMGKIDRIRFHAISAVNHGASLVEIQEVLLQATLYGGLANGQDAFEAAEAALRQAGVLEGDGETSWTNGSAEWRITTALKGRDADLDKGRK